MNETRFNVYYAVFNDHQRKTIGEAVLRNNRFTFKADPKMAKWFELRPDDYLRQVRGIIRGMVKDIGHTSPWHGRWNEPSGIGVERSDA